LAKSVSFVNVFSTQRPGFVWARGAMVNGEFVPGHWERARASGQLPPNAGPVVSPPFPGHTKPAETVLQVNGTETVITTLGPQTSGDFQTWAFAREHLMGLIGSDFHGLEEIGSAAFERASNNPVIPDFFNFWYPQARPHDHRAGRFHKHTLAGKIVRADIAEISGTYQDHDVNIDVRPNPGFEYLIEESHPREYTDIMSLQWTLSFHQKGQPNCDDPGSLAEFTYVECEVQPYHDETAAPAALLKNATVSRIGQDICVYGPWIYDKGHCCHPEIHPAEQIWWREDASTTSRVFHCNVFVDASKRFWWRDQMDDGTKLKPWGAPPIKGLFAIAFEAAIPQGPVVAVGSGPLAYEVAEVDRFNVQGGQGPDAVHTLTHQGRTLVSFTPHSDLFKVSWEKVGTDGGNKLRGFLVIECQAGTLVQKVVNSQFPAGTDVNAISQDDERKVFDKVDGHYMFTVSETAPSPQLGEALDSRFSVLRGRVVG
jgi:hypothetical protein